MAVRKVRKRGPFVIVETVMHPDGRVVRLPASFPLPDGDDLLNKGERTIKGER